MRLYEDVRALQARVGALQYLTLLVVALLLSHFWYLQVLRGRVLESIAEVLLEDGREPLLIRPLELGQAFRGNPEGEAGQGGRRCVALHTRSSL